MTNLHRTLIHLKSVDVLGGLCSAVGLTEDNGADATTDTVWSIGECDFLDGTHTLAKVVLQRRLCISPSAVV